MLNDNLREMQIKMTMKYHIDPHKQNSEKSDNVISWKGIEKQALSYRWWEYKLV